MLTGLFLYSSLFFSYWVLGTAAMTSPSTPQHHLPGCFRSWINSPIQHLLNLVILLLCFFFHVSMDAFDLLQNHLFSSIFLCKPMIHQCPVLIYYFQPHFCLSSALVAQVYLSPYHKTTFTQLFSIMTFQHSNYVSYISKIRTLLKILYACEIRSQTIKTCVKF